MSSARVLSAATEAQSSGINPWVVGAAVLALLLILMLAVLAFGGGRDHT
jgi:capsular polysaccharide biosynthesis protein